MVDYVPYPSNMHNDFELYSNNQEQMEYPLAHQQFLPTSTYSMDQTFSAPYDPMAPLAEIQRPHDLHFHYDAIAQGVKPFQFHTPAGSPHSETHSFHEQPPVLSASSESGASVSSSTLGSPAQFNESWNPVGLGFSSGFEYPGMIAAEKTFVGKSTVSSRELLPSPSVVSSSTPHTERRTFKTPVTPASAHWPLTRSNGRRNSLLSQVVRPCDVIPTATSFSAQFSLSHSHSHSLEFSCPFSSARSCNDKFRS